MSRRGGPRKGHGQIRRAQVVTTYGPGALIDLPRDSAIVAGLDSWPKPGDLEEILEPRLSGKIQLLIGKKYSLEKVFTLKKVCFFPSMVLLSFPLTWPTP